MEPAISSSASFSSSSSLSPFRSFTSFSLQRLTVSLFPAVRLALRLSFLLSLFPFFSHVYSSPLFFFPLSSYLSTSRRRIEQEDRHISALPVGYTLSASLSRLRPDRNELGVTTRLNVRFIGSRQRRKKSCICQPGNRCRHWLLHQTISLIRELFCFNKLCHVI